MVIKDAGRVAKPARMDVADPRRARIREVAQRLRAAQSDDEAADALEAAIELAKE